MLRDAKRFLAAAAVLPLLLGTAAPGELAPQEQQPAPPAGKVLRLKIKGAVHDGPPPLELFATTTGVNLRSITGAIRRAAADDGVKGLILELESPLLGWTQMQTLRRQLIEFRKSGKPSRCFLSSAGTSSYLVASACSELSLHPAGLVEIPGVQGQRIYMKQMLSKLGIEFQELRVGRYKSAAETLTRESASPPVREEMQSILDHHYQDLIQSLAENRSMAAVDVRARIDRRLFDPREARKAGLIDRIEYRDEFEERARKVGDETLEVADAQLAQKMNIDLSGFTGLMKLMNELLGSGKRRVASKTPKLALIVAEGSIVDSAESGLFFGQAITPAAMASAFEAVRADDSVKAVVFRVNSPGGSALASDRILRQVELTSKKKPVIVSMGDVAASGGYYVSCKADRILAEKGTLTGSIGVIGAVPSMRGLYDKVGLRVETYSRGKRADIVSAYGELTEDGRDMLMKFMLEIYDDFLGHVAAGRKLEKDAVASIAEGRVWTGQQALDLGLVDEIGGIEEALAHARKLAGLDDNVEILTLPRQKTLLELLQGGVRSPPLGFDALLKSLPAELKRSLRHVEWIARLEENKVLAVMPELISIR